jgi:hypothetical protein
MVRSREFTNRKSGVNGLHLVASLADRNDRCMFTAVLLAGFFLLVATQTDVMPVRMILLLLAALVVIGAGASEHHGS